MKRPSDSEDAPSSTNGREQAFRLLPAIDEVLRDPRARALAERAGGAGRALVQELAARELSRWRESIKSGVWSASDVAARKDGGALFDALRRSVERELGRGVVRAVNATGVVLNTGLGRAPVHPEVADAMRVAAESYCVLEVDRESGERNQRDDYLSDLLRRVTGAQAGIGVNNNAAAVLLAFNTFAGGRAAVVSRGELVEIGGSFRVPAVMERANVRLVEVGTTNRTRIGDYAEALGAHADVGLMIKVHTSNFRVVGFTEEASAAELAELGRAKGVTTVFDLGSGLLENDDGPPLGPVLASAWGAEPLVKDSVASGVDVVTFSGDKLLGGPQAGLLVGSRSAIAALRKNPMYRALRLDKVALAGLEATLRLYIDGRASEIPARAMLSASAQELEPRAQSLARELARLPGITCEIRPEPSQPGSGSAPGVELESWAVGVRHARFPPAELARALRAATTPVFARVHDNLLLLDVRTLLAGDPERLVASLRSVVAGAVEGPQQLERLEQGS